MGGLVWCQSGVLVVVSPKLRNCGFGGVLTEMCELGASATTSASSTMGPFVVSQQMVIATSSGLLSGVSIAFWTTSGPYVTFFDI